ncbi:MAG: PKD domain-containing protein [Candidatus Omnitrophica bacterium]|nr:PKD domain-containing protein [Candidatus Omnitrophota bacterium]
MSSWYFGNGGRPSHGQDASCSYEAAGEYTVTLEIIGPDGSDTASQAITVLEAFGAAISAFPADGYAPLSVSFSDHSTGNIIIRAWDLDGNGVFRDGQGTSASYTYDEPGDYTATLEIIGPDGSDTASVEIRVYEPVGPGQGGYGESGYGQSGYGESGYGQKNYDDPEISVMVGGRSFLGVLLSASYDGPGEYYWNFGDGSSSSGSSSVSHAYTEPGSYSIDLTIADPVTGETFASAGTSVVVGIGRRY